VCNHITYLVEMFWSRQLMNFEGNGCCFSTKFVRDLGNVTKNSVHYDYFIWLKESIMAYESWTCQVINNDVNNNFYFVTNIIVEIIVKHNTITNNILFSRMACCKEQKYRLWESQCHRTKWASERILWWGTSCKWPVLWKKLIHWNSFIPEPLP